jgi:hypothetical protein
MTMTSSIEPRAQISLLCARNAAKTHHSPSYPWQHVEAHQEKCSSETNEETSANIAGAVSNLVNLVLGAGILGMPYAIKQMGLAAGSFLIVLCAMMTKKSLRILIGTAKHVGISIYKKAVRIDLRLVWFLFMLINMVDWHTRWKPNIPDNHQGYAPGALG